MLTAHSFDLWQKDTFFSAAEEVQQSADIMDSAYKTWLRARKEGVTAQILDEFSRELQMALGTAKWQMFKRTTRSQRQEQISPTLPVSSIRALMLTLFLVVPVLFYSA